MAQRCSAATANHSYIQLLLRVHDGWQFSSNFKHVSGFGLCSLINRLSDLTGCNAHGDLVEGLSLREDISRSLVPMFACSREQKYRAESCSARGAPFPPAPPHTTFCGAPNALFLFPGAIPPSAAPSKAPAHVFVRGLPRPSTPACGREYRKELVCVGGLVYYCCCCLQHIEHRSTAVQQ